MLGNVADLVRLLSQLIGLQILMENRCVIAHGGRRGKHRGQRLVFHFDQSRRLLRDVNIDRRNARHGMALVADLVTGKNIVLDVFQRSVTLAHGEARCVRGEGQIRLVAL